MATRKKKEVETETWPKITVGSHSTRTEYEDGRVDFVTDWDALQSTTVPPANSPEAKKLVEEAPYHPGYEGAIVSADSKPKRTRKK